MSWLLSPPAGVIASSINSQSATDGWVLTADGAGASAWEAVPAAGAEVNDLTAAVTWTNIPIANVPTGTTSVTVSLGDHAHAGVYEPVDADIARHDTAGVTTVQWSVLTLVRGVTSDDTMVLTDAGKTIRSTGSTGAQTFTIPANGSVAYPIGTMIGVENDSSVAWSLAITTDTMTWSKDNTTGTRTLAAGASAVIKKVTSTAWKVSGSALVT